MAKSVAVKKHFSFVGGLNTEASPLTFPPNTWADGDNCVPDVDGSIVLRRAMDFEPSYSLSSVALTATQESTGAFTVGEWNSVGGNGNLHFLVVQQDITVSFYINSGTTISSQAKSFTINLSSYKAAGSTETSGVAPISVSNANGRLIIVSRDTEPLLVTYNASADTITVTQIEVSIRDFIGVDDGHAIDYRDPNGFITSLHYYNLLNQGWTLSLISTYMGATGFQPSNAQSWTAGKDSSDNFSATLLDKQDFGTSPAPKGRFVLNVFKRDRDAIAGTSGVFTDIETYRPTTCAFFAGRAWYSGVKSSTIGSWVMFSQVAETTTNLGKCYQDADPTSEVLSDLVDTDGGVIPIQDAGLVLKLLPFLNSLLVIADNGVWQITGGLSSGFSASSYEVQRLSSFGCISSESVVVTDQGVLFWGEDAIYAISQTQTGSMVCVPITAGTVQTLFDDIPVMGKIFSSGVYMPDQRIIYWLYNDDALQNGVEHRYQKNRVLVLDTRLKAFYTFTIVSLASLSPYVVEAYVTRTRSPGTAAFTVVDASGNNVIDASSNQVVSSNTPDVTASEIHLKFLAVVPQSASSFKVTMAEFNEADVVPICIRDWYHQDSAGVSFQGFVLPGYDFGENQGGDRPIQALYVSVFMRRTETGIDANGNPINPSSCSMQGRWDFSDTASSNRWSVSQEVYRHKRVWLPAVPSSDFNDGQPVVISKNKVRGRGKSLQLKFTSTPDKDMQMLGWAVTYIGSTNV